MKKGSALMTDNKNMNFNSLEFRKELTDLINKHSIENDLDIPDYVIASSIIQNILVFRILLQSKEVD
jgi:adenylyl- and sulfurtransferase ThiI